MIDTNNELLHQVTCIAREYRDGILDETLMVREMTAALSARASAGEGVTDEMVWGAQKYLAEHHPWYAPSTSDEVRELLKASLPNTATSPATACTHEWFPDPDLGEGSGYLYCRKCDVTRRAPKDAAPQPAQAVFYDIPGSGGTMHFQGDKPAQAGASGDLSTPQPAAVVRGEATGDTPTFLETWMKITTRDRAIISAYFRETTTRPTPEAHTGTVADIPDADLLCRAVHQLAPRARRQPAWARIADVFALGSTYATQLCRRFGVDPETGKKVAALALPAQGEG